MASRSISAGILLYRRCQGVLEVFLVHPGGPYFQHKDLGAWTIPKGLYEPEETPLACALREFREETGQEAPAGPYLELAPVKLKSGKVVLAWAAEGNCEPALVRSNMFKMEHPYRSGIWKEYPEIDRGEWFGVEEAKQKLNPAQASFVDQLQNLL